MASQTPISRDDRFAAFLTHEVSTGRCRASDAVRAGFPSLKDQEAQTSALRAALEAGENCGEPEEFDFDAFVASKRS
jgi:antitoxin ParD1/3/4